MRCDTATTAAPPPAVHVHASGSDGVSLPAPAAAAAGAVRQRARTQSDPFDALTPVGRGFLTQLALRGSLSRGAQEQAAEPGPAFDVVSLSPATRAMARLSAKSSSSDNLQP